MKKDKINLALLWSRYDGGVTSVNDLVLGLDKERFNTIFIYLTGYGVETNFIEEAGYDVFYLSNKKRTKGFRLSILFRLIRILKERNVDILHCHRHKSSSYGALAGMFAKTPVVLSHVHGLSRTRNMRRRLLNFFLFKRINRIIGCARSVRDDVLKNNPFVCPEKVIALENSVDFKRFADVSISKADAKQMLGLSSDAFVFGTIARFGPYKGHNFLVSAFQRVKAEVPSAQLVLVGEGPLKEDVQRQVAAAGIKQSVHFLGQRKDIPELLAMMDVFVLPSIGSEGMPRVILEAMAAGVPCIGTKIGGTPEVISNNDIGYVVESRDSEALSRAMISVANLSHEGRQKLIGNARAQVQNFYSHDVVGVKLAKLYEDRYLLSQVSAK